MKKISLIIGLALLMVSCENLNNRDKETKYCGVVVEKGYDAPSSGYKSHTDPEYLIYLREDRTHKVIRVEVNVPTYYDLSVGKRTCFTLKNWQLNHCGNTNDSNKNLYGE